MTPTLYQIPYSRSHSYYLLTLDTYGFVHLTSTLHTGQFGKVYKATLVRARSENMTVAVKTIKKYKSEEETSDFLHEMGVMMDLMHPNIIHLYGIVQQGLIIIS